MRKTALLYNPDSGGSRRRLRELHAAFEILRAGGVEAELVPTSSREHAGEEARKAIGSGCDTILACGGDGTVHNIAQVLTGSSVALGVLPMGTANALAKDLGLPLRVADAAKAALRAVPRRIAVGQIVCVGLNGSKTSRYFVVAAGMGVDAYLFYKLHSGAKKKLGMGAYYAKAWNMWFTYAMPRFHVEYLESETGARKNANVTELLAVRISQFGGVVRELAPGASLDRDDVRLVLCRTKSRAAYLAYVTGSLLGAHWKVPGIDLDFSVATSCSYGATATGEAPPKVYVEADGELIGSLPAELKIIPQALTLLAPPR